MCCEKNSRALAALAGGGVPVWQLPGQRAACLQGGAVKSRDLPISQSQRFSDRASYAHPRDRADQSTVRIPEDPRAAEPRGLESRHISGSTNLSGRGIDAAAAAETASPGSGASPRTVSANSAESSVVDGLAEVSTKGPLRLQVAEAVFLASLGSSLDSSLKSSGE